MAFLIGGLARSGTTLVQRIVTELNGVYVPPETHFWRHAQALSTGRDFPLDRAAAQAALEQFIAMDSSTDLLLDVDAATASLPEASYLWDLFEAIVENLSPAGDHVLGEKTPDHLRFAPQLLAAIPSLKLFGVVRDPREVLRSHRSVPWGITDPVRLAEKWVETTRILEDCQQMFPGRVAVHRLEDIVCSPDAVRAGYATLLGVDDVVDGLPTGAALFPEWETWKQKALEPIMVADQTWTTELSSSDIALIEQRAATEMKRFGYELSEIGASGGSTAPAPSTTSWLEVRRAGARIAYQPLPITEETAADWQDSPARKLAIEIQRVDSWRSHTEEAKSASDRWKARAEELAKETKRLRDWIDSEKAARDELSKETKRLRDWIDSEKAATAEQRELRTRAERQLASTREELASSRQIATSLTGDLAKATAEANRHWRRAESIASESRKTKAQLRASQSQALRYNRSRIRAQDNLARLKSRRWWRLGVAIGKLKHSPLRIDTFVRDVWRITANPVGLPPYRDLSEIDDRLARLKLAAESTSPAVSTADRVRALIATGDLEDAMETLGTDEALAHTPQGMLLLRDIHIALGEVSMAIADIRVARTMHDSPELRKQERILVGRIVETEPTWLPDAGPEQPLDRVNGDTILHILKESLPFFERGYTIRSMTTLLAQQQAGYRPVVATTLGFPRQQGFTDFPMRETINGIEHHRLDLGPSYNATGIPYDLRLSDDAYLMAKLAHDLAPAAIQAGSGYRGYDTALVGLSVARSLGVPLIYEIRSFLEQTWTGDVSRSVSGEYYERRFGQEVRCLKDADHVITIADAMKDEIVARGIDPDKISVAPNVVDTERFSPRERSEELIERYGLGARPVLGYISNLGWREGIEYLVEAVRLLRTDGHDVCGFVVGEGPEMEKLRSLVDEYGLQDDFILTGHVPNEQIEDHYALIDLFVVPRVNDRASRYVTPLKPLEAMAMAIPVITAELPALRELVSPGKRGFVFETENARSLADVALEALADPEYTRKLALAGQAWVRSERTIAANASRYRDILGSVLSGRPT